MKPRSTVSWMPTARYVKGGAQSHSEVAADFGLTEDLCQKYQFNLTNGQLVGGSDNPLSERAARTHLDRILGASCGEDNLGRPDD